MFDELDLRLCAILDPLRSGNAGLPDLARRLAAGGATLIELRDDRGAPRDIAALARAVKDALPPRVPLIVRDRVEIVAAAGIDGVRLGADGMDPRLVRGQLGPVPFIGLTLRTAREARAAPLAIVDYVVADGVFAPGSDAEPCPAVGIAGLQEIIEVFRDRIGNFPVCAAGGIGAADAAAAIAAGAEGLAMDSALARLDDAADPAHAARELRTLIDAALKRRAPFVPDTRERRRQEEAAP
ncbi:MAG TPA: thiamine phosphate synthase [Xanthobacteraceae bacterium]|nr:thiamine phosphate synthase [Xanthobacteraceae bacterium]